jgi:iron complex outermembrane recepter protein
MKLLHRQTADVRARLCVEAATAGKPAHETLSRSLKKGCVLGLSLTGALNVSAALAQEDKESGGLEEIVVTATRQIDTVNRVPLTITAVTQDRIDQQGIKNVADLTRFVPGLATVANPGGGQQTFSIRGIVGGNGAATTSVYLDDTNITKRSNGGVAQNNGVVVPLLYDLARVEVLKGPQGTLYGGSSQGGTVRYITPAPSLIETTGSTRIEGSSMGSDGEMSYEAAGAFGTPLVKDKLGIRVSGIYRESGGWVDTVSAYTGRTIEEDANSETEWAGRVALLWQVTDRLSAQLSGYHVDYESEGGASTTTKIFADGNGAAGYQGAAAAAGTTFTTQARCTTNNTRPISGTSVTLANPTPWYPTAQPGLPGASSFVPVTSTAPAAIAGCAAGNLRPSRTYGPFRTGEYINLATAKQTLSPAGSESDIAALTLSFDFENFNVKSITSYINDKGFSNAPGGEEWASTTPPTTINNVNGNPAVSVTGSTGQSLVNGPTSPAAPTVPLRGFPLFQDFFDATGLGHSQIFAATNERDGFEQEFRISSTAEGSRLSWVAGIYLADLDTNIHYENLISPQMSDLVMQLMYGAGATSLARYGVANTTGDQGWLDADLTDKEYAAFGEANYWILPDKLRATLGVRYSKVELEYYQLAFGQTNGRTALSDGSITQGNLSEEPLTPKVGLQYQFTDDKMAYLSASKGFRAGGVNPEISQTICAAALQPFGITARDIPRSYDADTVWSYELGTKLRIVDNLQINLAAFRIDWDDVQSTTALSCGQSFTSNGESARSEGAEIQVQYQPITALGLYVNASYTDAYYVDPVRAPSAPGITPTASFNAGDKFNIPPFQLSAGAQFDFTLGESLESYLRLDGTYADDYTSGATFNSSGYAGNYFLKDKPTRTQVNLRTGVRLDNGLEVNAFVLNVLNDEDQIVAGLSGFGDGRGTCSAASADCSTFSSYNPFVNQAFQEPRRYGVQVNYKF